MRHAAAELAKGWQKEIDKKLLKERKAQGA
jgi:hypothetical protein